MRGQFILILVLLLFVCGRKGGGGAADCDYDHNDTDDEMEEQIWNDVVGGIRKRVNQAGSVVGLTADTVASLAGAPLKAAGGITQGISTVLREGGKALEGGPRDETKRSNPLGDIAGLGKRGLGSVLKISGTALGGVGEVVWQSGSVAEDFISDTGGVARDMIKIVDGGLGVLTGGVQGIKEEAETLEAEQANGNLSHVVEDSSDQPAADRSQAYIISDMVKGMLRLIRAYCTSYFGKIHGVSNISRYLTAAFILLYSLRKRRRFLGVLVVVWCLLVAIERRQRGKLVWVAEQAAYRNVMRENGIGHMWLQSMLDKFWIEGTLGKYASETAAAAFEEVLEGSKPQTWAISLVDVNLGNTVAPIIRNVTEISGFDAPAARIRNNPTFNVGFDVAAGGMGVTLDIKMSELSQAKVPKTRVQVSEFHLTGRMLMSIEILRGHPFIGQVYLSFSSVPEVYMHVTGAALEVITLGSVDEWLTVLVQGSLRQYVAPKHMVICPLCEEATCPTDGKLSVDRSRRIETAVRPGSSTAHGTLGSTSRNMLASKPVVKLQDSAPLNVAANVANMADSRGSHKVEKEEPGSAGHSETVSNLVPRWKGRREHNEPREGEIPREEGSAATRGVTVSNLVPG